MKFTFFDFLKLYMGEPDIDLGRQFALAMLIEWLSSAEYIVEFYRLVRRKALRETVAVMRLPLGAAILLAYFLNTEVAMPKMRRLPAFHRALDEPETALGLFLLSLICAALLFQAWLLWSKHKLSYVTGVIQCAAVGVPSLCMLLIGKNFFRQLPSWVLLGFLYLVLLLITRTLLLLAGTIVCVCTAKRKPRWSDRKNPTLFFWFYELFCQNGMLRGILLFWTPVAALYLAIWTSKEVAHLRTAELDDFILGTWITVAILAADLAVTLQPAFSLARLLKKKGYDRTKLALFCREYFTEQPISAGKSYTATRHFLIDEEDSHVIFYEWDELNGCSNGWVMGAQGAVGVMRFQNGRICEIPREDPQADELMRIARQRLAGMRPTAQRELPTFGTAVVHHSYPDFHFRGIGYFSIAIGVCLIAITMTILLWWIPVDILFR